MYQNISLPYGMFELGRSFTHNNIVAIYRHLDLVPGHLVINPQSVVHARDQ